MNDYKGLKVRKYTFEEEQKEKDEHFLSLTPFQRLEVTLEVRSMMRKKGVNYSFVGQKVRVTRNATS
jgi:hypothetical protein